MYQARIVVILTTDKSSLQHGHHSTRLDMAGRLACDHRGYLYQLAVNSSRSLTWQTLRSVTDLLRPSPSDHRQTITSTRVSEFDNQPVLTVSRTVTTDNHR